MLEFLRQYRRLVTVNGGAEYTARAYASPSPRGTWEAWFAFFPVNGGPIVTSGPAAPAETLEAVDHWTRRISSFDLRRALDRALTGQPWSHATPDRAPRLRSRLRSRVKTGGYDEEKTDLRKRRPSMRQPPSSTILIASG